MPPPSSCPRIKLLPGLVRAATEAAPGRQQSRSISSTVNSPIPLLSTASSSWIHRRPSSSNPRLTTAATLTTATNIRNSSTTAESLAAGSGTVDAADIPPAPSSRWLSDLKARLGKCIIFGCDGQQTARAAAILRVVARDWRELTAGCDGFLTTTVDAGGRRRRRGLDGQQVIWGEMDSFQHVNNVAYIRYAESARVNWVLQFGEQDPANREAWRTLMQPEAVGLIMKSIKANYKFPMVYPDHISVYHKLRNEPKETDTSLFLDVVVLSHAHHRVSCRLEEDIAIYDYRKPGITPIPPFALDVLKATWQAQEAAKLEARRLAWGLISAVEALEKETWDRPDAVEDVGAAGKK